MLVKSENRYQRVHMSSTAELREFILNAAPNIISPQTSLEHVYDGSRKLGDTIRHSEQTFALRTGVHYVPFAERANKHAGKDV